METPSIIAVVFSTITVIVTVASYVRGPAKELRDKAENALNRLTVLEMKMEVFWKLVSVSSAQALHSPHTPELDRLIEKFQQEKINDFELLRFKELLKEVADDPEENKFRQKAALEVLALIHVRYEIASM